jgi:peptidyl-prolyl cis-trans isomerase SurA
MYINNRFRFIAVVLALEAMLSLSVTARVVDRVAAVVNSEVVLLSEVDRICGPAIGAIPVTLSLDEQVKQKREIRKKALDTLIDDLLIRQKIVEHQIKVSDEEVAKSVHQLMRDNNMNEEQFNQALAMEGKTLAELKNNFKKQMEQSRLVDAEVRNNPEMRSKFQISENDIEDFYRSNYLSGVSKEKVKASHVLFSIPAGTAPDKEKMVEQQAEKVLKLLRQGANFTEIAKQYSSDPSSALGGDLGWFYRGDMVTEFENAAFSLKKGEISGLVRTRFGIHIIMVTDRAADSAPPLDKVRNEIRSRLYRENYQKTMQEWLKGLRTSAVIEYKL